MQKKEKVMEEKARENAAAALEAEESNHTDENVISENNPVTPKKSCKEEASNLSLSLFPPSSGSKIESATALVLHIRKSKELL